MSWATGLCSAHQDPDPLCRICNPVIAELMQDQDELIKAREAMSEVGVEKGHLPALIKSLHNQLARARTSSDLTIEEMAQLVEARIESEDQGRAWISMVLINEECREIAAVLRLHRFMPPGLLAIDKKKLEQFKLSYTYRFHSVMDGSKCHYDQAGGATCVNDDHYPLVKALEDLEKP